MRLQRTIVLILAVFGAGLVGFLVYFFTLDEPEPEQPPQVVVIDPETGEPVIDPETGQPVVMPATEAPPPPPPMTDILTVTRDIAVGETLRVGDLTWTSWLDTDLTGEHITRIERPEAIRELTGDIATAAIFATTPVAVAQILDVSSSNVFATLITPGNRAITIPVSATSSVAGLIEHNDRVDVIFTRSGGAGDGFGAPPASEVLITNARILAVDQSYGQILELTAGGGIPSTVTLELSPEAAVLLESKRPEGSFSLVLRGTAAAAEPQTRVVPQEEEGKFVRVVRDGVTQIIPVREGEP